MEFKLKVGQEQFTNDNGEVIEYFSYIVEIGGETVRLYPKDEDKKLLKHLVKQELAKKSGAKS